MSLDLSRIQALCFDVDGTLSDTDDYYVAKFSTWLRRMPFMDNPDITSRRLVMWLESPGNAFLGLADTVGLDDEMIAILNWASRRRKFHRRPLPVILGVPELLGAIHRLFPLAVVSARDEDHTMTFLEQHNLARHFDTIITALSASRTKPHADPIQLAARNMGVSTDSCLMIGDTTMDIRSGKAADAQTIGVLCGFGYENELRRAGADLILQTTADLRGVLMSERS